MQSLQQNFLIVWSRSSLEYIYETKFNIKHKKIVEEILSLISQFSIFMAKQKILEKVLFWKLDVFFTVSDFSLKQEVHQHNFVGKTRDIKLPMLMMKFSMFF